MAYPKTDDSLAIQCHTVHILERTRAEERAQFMIDKLKLRKTLQPRGKRLLMKDAGLLALPPTSKTLLTP